MASEKHHMTSSEDKIPVTQKIGYGLGGMATQVAVNSISNLFLPIYNIGLGVSPALLGIGQGVPRALDAIFDPLIGNLSDNTRSRFGRRIPYVFVGGILLGVTFALLWMVPKGLGEYKTFGYFLIMSMLFYITTSIFEIPRGALGLEMSNDYHERTRLFAYYSFIVNVGALTTPWLYWLATRKSLFTDEVMGMRTIGLAMGGFFIISSVICAMVCKEQKLNQAKTQEKVKLWDGIITTSRNRTFVRLLVITCLVTVGFNFVVGFSSYILIYYVFSGDKQAASVWMGWCGTLWAVLSLGGVFVMTWIATRLGKSKTLMIFLIVMAVGNLLKIVCYNRSHPWLVLIPTAAIAMGMLVLFTLVFAMIADICDEDELKTGKRREGSFQAMYWWWFKIGVGLAFVAAGFLLKSTGINEKLAVQSDSTLFWLRFWEITLPSAVCFCGAMLLIKYPLTERRAYEIKTILARRKCASVPQQPVVAELAGMGHKKGFTLIELLVVIAIIALLLSILVPSLSKAKEYAKSVICKSNMHSYALAGQAYLWENRNSFPHPIICIDGRATFTSAYTAAHPKECRWHDEGVVPQGPFWPYLDMNKVNTCPTFTAVAKSRLADHQAYLTSVGGNVNLCSTISMKPRLSYSMNGFLGAGDETENLVAINGVRQMPKVTNIKCPSAMLFVTEENTWTITKSVYDIQVSRDAWNDMYFMPAKYGNGDSLATFHKARDSKLITGVSNVLFVDFHVEEKKAYDQEDIANRSSSKSWYLVTQNP